MPMPTKKLKLIDARRGITPVFVRRYLYESGYQSYWVSDNGSTAGNLTAKEAEDMILGRVREQMSYNVQTLAALARSFKTQCMKVVKREGKPVAFYPKTVQERFGYTLGPAKTVLVSHHCGAGKVPTHKIPYVRFLTNGTAMINPGGAEQAEAFYIKLPTKPADDLALADLYFDQYPAALAPLDLEKLEGTDDVG